jgi:phosphopantetheinyl transferase (holo-ACP synthase)
MISAGNDIVALTAINAARTKQPEFYSKILSPAEKSLYQAPLLEAIPFEIFVWLLWSVKESAYKFLQRLEPALLFTPVKFEVRELNIPAGFIINNFNGEAFESIGFADCLTIESTLNFGEFMLYSRSLIYDKLLLSTVNNTDNFDAVYWGIKVIESADTEVQSTSVREFLLNRLKALGFKNPVISKNGHGIPVLLDDDEETAVPISLSHHDCLIAYAFRLNNAE